MRAEAPDVFARRFALFAPSRASLVAIPVRRYKKRALIDRQARANVSSGL